MSGTDTIDHPSWPLRALLLAVLGGACGILFDQLIGGAGAGSPWRAAAATFLAVAGVAFAFSLERLRWEWSAAFAVGAGITAGFVGWWNGAPDGWSGGTQWQFIAGLFAVAIAVPLFQAARDQGALRFPPAAVHAHLWTNLILAAVAGAFVGASVLLTVLLAELFALIGIDLLRDLLQDGWILWMVACGALGAAVGLLRDRDAVLGLLQRVVRTILSVLAPVLAAGLVLFVLALPFTGLDPLWEKTKSTTPILLVCVLGAVLLVTAVAGNGDGDERRPGALRWAAAALIAVMLPLALVAAVSTAKRIGQYGFTPDRLWAAVFVAAAAAFGLGYLVALVRGRGGWPALLREANVRLAAGVCLLALFLALPIVSFGAISARDQVARLEQGRVSPDRFDWRALRFDFGPAGLRALERIARTGPAALRGRAAEALKAESRWALAEPETHTPPPLKPPRLAILPVGAVAPRALQDEIARTRACAEEECRLILDTPTRAVLLVPNCPGCPTGVRLFDATPRGHWTEARRPADAETAPIRPVEAPPRAPASVEVRTIEMRQVFIDGKPVGPVYDQPS